MCEMTAVHTYIHKCIDICIYCMHMYVRLYSVNKVVSAEQLIVVHT